MSAAPVRHRPAYPATGTLVMDRRKLEPASGVWPTEREHEPDDLDYPPVPAHLSRRERAAQPASGVWATGAEVHAPPPLPLPLPIPLPVYDPPPYIEEVPLEPVPRSSISFDSSVLLADTSLAGASMAQITRSALGYRQNARRLRRTSVLFGVALLVAIGFVGWLAAELALRPPLYASRSPRDAFGGAHRLERYDGVEVKVLSAPPKPERARVRRPRAPRPASIVDLTDRDLFSEALRD